MDFEQTYCTCHLGAQIRCPQHSMKNGSRGLGIKEFAERRTFLSEHPTIKPSRPYEDELLNEKIPAPALQELDPTHAEGSKQGPFDHLVNWDCERTKRDQIIAQAKAQAKVYEEEAYRTRVEREQAKLDRYSAQVKRYETNVRHLNADYPIPPTHSTEYLEGYKAGIEAAIKLGAKNARKY